MKLEIGQLIEFVDTKKRRFTGYIVQIECSPFKGSNNLLVSIYKKKNICFVPQVFFKKFYLDEGKIRIMATADNSDFKTATPKLKHS